jgi:hypothetical protein
MAKHADNIMTGILWCTILLGESCRIPVDGMRRWLELSAGERALTVQFDPTR